MELLHTNNKHFAYSCLRAVVDTLRDRLIPDEAINMGAQMPMLLRGMYYEGWNPGPTATVERHADEFLAKVADAIPRRPEYDAERVVLGQYEGYLKEKQLAPGSSTPTYVALRLFIDNWRWHGVPFYLRTGKGLPEKRTEVSVEFRCPPEQLLAEEHQGELHPNVLRLCIQPDEGAHLRIEAKMPGEGMLVVPVDMEFHYREAFPGKSLADAYDRLLEDALDGDPALFIRADQVEEAWRIVEPLLGDPPPLSLLRYEVGSWGPDKAQLSSGSMAANGSPCALCTSRRQSNAHPSSR